MLQPNPPAAAAAPPARATGGCLCGAIRYTILFTPGHDFISNSAKCLCTACRKQSGALVIHMHAVPLSAFSCVAPPAALGDYSCSPGCHRLFCRRCGSYIAWQQDPLLGADVHGSADVGGARGVRKMGSVGAPGRRGVVLEEGEVEICVGTLDEEFLVGQGGEEMMGWGGLLAHPEGRVLWGENEIVGVTDGVPGQRFRHGPDSNLMMPEYLLDGLGTEQAQVLKDNARGEGPCGVQVYGK